MAELKLNISQTSNEAFTDLLVYSGYPRQYTGSEFIEVLELTGEGTDGTTKVKLKIKGDLATKLVDTGNIGYEDKGDHKIPSCRLRCCIACSICQNQGTDISAFPLCKRIRLQLLCLQQIDGYRSIGREVQRECGSVC